MRDLIILPYIGDILRLLENGEWHDLKEMSEKTRISELNFRNVTKFLAEHDFVELNEGEQKIRLNTLTKRFLRKIRQLEDEEMV